MVVEIFEVNGLFTDGDETVSCEVRLWADGVDDAESTYRDIVEVGGREVIAIDSVVVVTEDELSFWESL